ncbi:MAG: ankyrin repeat domain-containing protein [Bryobacteraceae bacterium]|jgi:ankyrin repeat protein
MNTDFTPLPARPNLEQYKKQAKDLAKAIDANDAEAVRLVKKYHPRSGQALDSKFALSDAQLAIARQHGFESWPNFSKHIEALTRENSPISKFELAADAIVTGDAATLQTLLGENPELVRARSTRVHRATLLHYLGANGFEDYRQKSPANAVEIARILLDAGAEVDAVAEAYGKSTALSLVATSVHPKRAGVQIALMETLLDYGADIDGPAGVGSVNPALGNGRPEAAEFLARRGARLDLEGAAGVGRLDLVASFFNGDGSLKASATRAQMNAGFLWACEYGRNSVVEFLLQRGADLNAAENTGLTGLHWAVVGGQLDTIKLLLERGAALETKNVYGGTALGTALWAAFHGDPGVDYVPIIETLLDAGAEIRPGALEWLAEQEGRTPSVTARIAEVLRRRRAAS